MTELRRIKAGIFSEENIITLYAFQEAVEEYKKGNENKLREILIPAEIIVKILPAFQAKEDSVKKLLIGKPIFKEDLKENLEDLKENTKFAVFSDSRFIEVAKIVKDKDILAKPEFVYAIV